MAQDEVIKRKTNSEWIRNQNEYEMLISIRKNAVKGAKSGSSICPIYLMTGDDSEFNSCNQKCDNCLQMWLYRERK